MNLLGEPLRVGQHIHSGQHRVRRETIEFYQETFGDQHPFYVAANPFGGPIAPPLLYHSEVYRHPERWYLKNLVGNLHAQQEWFLYAPLRLDMLLQTRSTLVDRFVKRDREYLVNEVDYTDEQGQLRVRGRSYQSFLLDRPASEGKFVVDEGAAQRKPRRPVGEGPGQEVDPLELTVDRTLCWRFSGPERNYHTDVEAARQLGFPEIVVQGMLSTCLISQLMGRAFDESWFAGGRMSVKLVNVLWAGEQIRVRGKWQAEQPEGSFRRKELEVWVEKTDAARTLVAVGVASALV